MWERLERLPVTRRKTGRRVGRQAAIMMTWASTEDMISSGVVTSVVLGVSWVFGWGFEN